MILHSSNTSLVTEDMLLLTGWAAPNKQSRRNRKAAKSIPTTIECIILEIRFLPILSDALEKVLHHLRLTRPRERLAPDSCEEFRSKVVVCDPAEGYSATLRTTDWITAPSWCDAYFHRS